MLDRFSFSRGGGAALVASLALFSISCGEKSDKPSKPKEKPKQAEALDPDEIQLRSLEQLGRVWRQVGSTEPFTGQAVSRYGGGAIESKSDYKEGVIQLEVKWLKSGNKKSETTFTDGIANFEKIWRGDGSKKIESGLIGDVAHGTHKRWHPNGQLHLNAEYHEGKWNGLVEDYDEAGKLIHKATYKMGKLVEDLLPKE